MSPLSLLQRDVSKYTFKQLSEMTQELINKENKIIRSEKILNSVLEASPIAVVLIENRKVSWANQKCADLLKIPLNKIIGKDTKEFYYNESDYIEIGNRTYETHNRGCKTGERKTFLKQGDGSKLEIFAQYSFLNGGNSVVVFFYDVVELIKKCNQL